ncbi:MAG: M50 family metallopeptidase [Candidatus Methanoperedens sp.]
MIFSLLLIQGIMVNFISRNIGKISFRHPYLFRAMNWWGIFIHELSHAVTAIATMNKVKEFKVTSNSGYVVHGSNGRGFLQWLSGQLISISPAFVPPIITSVLLIFFGYIDFHSVFRYAQPLEPASIISALYLGSIPEIVKTLGWLFINLDYTKGKNTLLLLVFVFSFSAAKPSSIDKKYRLEGDLQSLIRGFFGSPIYTIFFILLGILFFWIILRFDQSFFSTMITFLIFLPILSFFGLAFNFLFIRLINIYDESKKLHFIISLLISVVVYVIMAQHIEKQYVINMIGIVVLIGLLKLKNR